MAIPAKSSLSAVLYRVPPQDSQKCNVSFMPVSWVWVDVCAEPLVRDNSFSGIRMFVVWVLPLILRQERQ
jgi:hypothetical protein